MPPENTRVLVCNLTLLFSFLAVGAYIDKSPLYHWGEETFNRKFFDDLNHFHLKQEKIDFLTKLSKDNVHCIIDALVALYSIYLSFFCMVLLHETKLLHKPLPIKDTFTLIGHRLYSIFQPSRDVEGYPDDCPDEFICPISYQVMKRPVYSVKYPKLHRCDEHSLLEWLRHHNRHPLLGNVPYVESDWVEDTELKTQISNYFYNKNGQHHTILSYFSKGTV